MNSPILAIILISSSLHKEIPPFKFVFTEFEDFETLKIFKPLEIMFEGKKIFKDSVREYEFSNKFPKIFEFRSHKEILLNVNDRPSDNYLLRLKFIDGKINSIDTIPFLKGNWENRDKDEFKENYSWETFEAVCLKCDSVVYSPKIFYEIKNNGIYLDTNLTIEENIKYFGKFYGFKYDKRIIIKIKK